MKEYKTCEEVLQALKNGKKVVGVGHLRRLCEGGIGCQEQKWYKILYYYCNPQMNRTFAMLENGMSVDSSIDVLDFLYGKFYEYEDVENTEIPRKLTKEFKTSDTTLTAEWMQDKIWSHLWHCSNCNDGHRCEVTTRLSDYCQKCGAKMLNPQVHIVEYDYD